MSEIFLSYRFSGECPKHLEDVMGNITKSLNSRNYQVFCSLGLEEEFQNKQMTSDEIYAYCSQRQENSDIFMPIIKSEHPSSGMVMELEKAIELNQKNILLIQQDLEFPQFREAAQQIIEYQTLPDLYKTLETISFE